MRCWKVAVGPEEHEYTGLMGEVREEVGTVVGTVLGLL